jgi:RsiW-degrading membrane proteinase PrsW (M82 family)
VSFEPILLAPEAEVEEIYPYRRVWRTSWLEIGALFMLVMLIYALNLFSVLPSALNTPVPRVGLAVFPLLTWLVFSYRGERRAPQPRQRLAGVLILGALVASGVAVPLEERLLAPERWLPTQGFFGRAFGYMFTLGITAEFLKYAALRYTVWPGRIRQRLDSIAYALAVSVGFAVAQNLRFALFTDATLIATALRVASITFSQVAIGLVMGFFLAELAISRVPIFWLPAGLGIASFLSGVYYGFRGIAIVGGLSVAGTGAAPARGLALAFGLVAVMFAIFAFIIQSADARMEAAAGQRPAL